MKIAIDARIINTTTGRYVRKLLQNLQELDSKDIYYVLLTKKDYNTWKPVNNNFKKVLADVAQYSMAEQSQLLLILNKLKCDVVHFTMPQQPVLYRGKTVTTIHDLTLVRYKNKRFTSVIYTLKHLIFRWLFRYVAKKTDQIIVPTQFVQNDIENYVRHKNKPITVTYESADKITDSPSPIEQITNKQYIMYVGQMAPYKNLARLIDAYQLLLKKHPALHLVIAGKIDENASQLQKRAQQNGLSNVTFTGFVSDGQLRWLYQHAQAYIFPSESEGFGLPGLEAMQHGCPVASSNATCLPEVYQNAAHYFDPYDVEDMASKIDQILTSPQLRQKLINNSVVLLKKYSWEKMARETLAVYKSALKKSS